MTRITITIDEQLISKAVKLLGVKTKSEAIRVALQDVVRRQRLARARQHQGQIDLQLDQDALQQHRADK